MTFAYEVRMPEENAADIEAMRETLRKAADAGPPSRNKPKSKAEQIRMLRSEIAVLRTRGWKWDDVAVALSQHLDASADTIRLAIGETNKRLTSTRMASGTKEKSQSTQKRSQAEELTNKTKDTKRARTVAEQSSSTVAKAQPKSDKHFGARKL